MRPVARPRKRRNQTQAGYGTGLGKRGFSVERFEMCQGFLQQGMTLTIPESETFVRVLNRAGVRSVLYMLGMPLGKVYVG